MSETSAMKRIEADPHPRRPSWRRFIEIYRPIRIPWVLLTVYFALGILAAQVTLWIAPLFARITRGDFTAADLVPSFIGLTIGSIVVVFGRQLAEIFASGRVERNLRSRVWERLIHAPSRIFDRRNAPEQVSRVTNDPRGATAALLALAAVWSSLYGFIGAVIAMTQANAVMGLLFVLTAPVTALLFWFVGYTEFVIQRRLMRAWGTMTAFFGEHLNMLKSLKMLGIEPAEKAAGDRAIDSMFRAGIVQAFLRAAQTLAGSVVQTLVTVLVFVGGAAFVRSGDLAQNDLVLFNALAGAAMPFLFEILAHYQAVKGAQGFTQNLGEVLRLPEEETAAGSSMPREPREIRLDHVSFSYTDRDVLRDVSAVIPAGKVTAIVGTNGSGKSTLLRLLQRIYEPSSGTIRLGRRPVHDFALEAWRKAVAIVPQNAPVLSGTVRDNIAFCDLDLSDEDVRRASEVGSADEFIDVHPDGYQMRVGENGSTLSGGQRQRISIARAVAAQPQYLLLDEASSALDSRTDARIDAALTKAGRGKTVVVVSHRLSTVADADQIIVLRDGCVEATGRHSELLGTSPTYRELADAEEQRFPDDPAPDIQQKEDR